MKFQRGLSFHKTSEVHSITLKHWQTAGAREKKPKYTQICETVCSCTEEHNNQQTEGNDIIDITHNVVFRITT